MPLRLRTLTEFHLLSCPLRYDPYHMGKPRHQVTTSYHQVTTATTRESLNSKSRGLAFKFMLLSLDTTTPNNEKFNFFKVKQCCLLF